MAHLPPVATSGSCTKLQTTSDPINCGNEFMREAQHDSAIVKLLNTIWWPEGNGNLSRKTAYLSNGLSQQPGILQVRDPLLVPIRSQCDHAHFWFKGPNALGIDVEYL